MTAPQTPIQAVTNGRAKVALLVPLTGPNSTVGQAMLDAANMALFDVSTDIALLPRDTGSTPDGASAATSRALSEGSGLILGPVFAGEVGRVREALNGSPVSAIVYSTDVKTDGRSPVGDDFMGANRVRISAASSVQTNIADFLRQLEAADLTKPMFPAQTQASPGGTAK